MADYTEYYEFALKLAAEAGDLIRAGIILKFIRRRFVMLHLLI